MRPTRARVLPFETTSTGAASIEYARPSTSSQHDPQTVQEVSQLSFAPIVVRPNLIPLMDFGDRLRLRYPLFVVVEESDGAMVVSSYDLELAEFGVTEFEAIAEFKIAVVELYVAIKEMGDDAPAHLASKLRFLDAIAL